jgi:peptidylprolyl isomerase
VPSQKRDRQWVSSRAKAAAAEAARRRKNRKRLGAALGLGVLVIAIVGAAAFAGGGSSKTASTAASTSLPPTSPTTTLPSAAGLPCVAMNDTPPPGAPNVPVQVGPAPTALISQDLKPGTGADVTPASNLTVNYIGVSCSTGKIFDSSWKDNKPASFSLNGVIKGWQQGLTGMKVGGERLLGIPPDLGYGDNPPPGIAPGETLWFVVDVISAS